MQTAVGHAQARSAAFDGPPSPPTNASRVGAHLCSSEQTGVCSSAAVPHAGALEETRVRVFPLRADPAGRRGSPFSEPRRPTLSSRGMSDLDDGRVATGRRFPEPKSPAAGLILPQAVLLLQPLFKCWTGRCATCQQTINLANLPLHRAPQDE